MRVTLGFAADIALENAVDALATAQGRSRAEYLRRLVANGVAAETGLPNDLARLPRRRNRRKSKYSPS